ncbi:TetR/AcrR family transcriptional regulator [Planktotalea arctica]|uniref:TetR/AcrR family transcriptional regulator n=1 Tax=Planktotalea arctica TaxID=1481893 RepID=UPI000A16E4EF|nr:TetR/AcrR family transcriptional regulator [Planktotalea arctica]
MARPIAKDHGAKRLHILREAARVFAEVGIARASMAQVAVACGVSKANIYHYYDSKDALLFDILDSYLSALRDRLVGLDLVDLEPSSQLLSFVTEVLLAYDGMDAEHQIQTEGIGVLAAAEQQVLKGYQRDMVRQLSGILQGAAPAHLVSDKARLTATTMSVFGMLNWFYMWNSSADRAARESYAAHVSGLVLGAQKSYS